MKIKSKYKLGGLSLGALTINAFGVGFAIACSENNSSTSELFAERSKIEAITTTVFPGRDFNDLEFTWTTDFKNGENLGIFVKLNPKFQIYFQKKANSQTVSYTIEEIQNPANKTTFDVTFNKSIADHDLLSKLQTHLLAKRTTSLSGFEFSNKNVEQLPLSDQAQLINSIGIEVNRDLLKNGVMAHASKQPMSLVVQYVLEIPFQLCSKFEFSTEFEGSDSDLQKFNQIETYLKNSLQTSLDGRYFRDELALEKSSITNANNPIGLVNLPSDLNENSFTILASKARGATIVNYEANFETGFKNYRRTFAVDFQVSQMDQQKVNTVAKALQETRASSRIFVDFSSEEFLDLDFETAKQKLGIDLPSIPSGVQILASKLANSLNVQYKITLQMASTTLGVSFNEWPMIEDASNLQNRLMAIRETNRSSARFYQTQLALTNFNNPAIVSELGINLDFNALAPSIASLKVSKLMNSNEVHYEIIDQNGHRISFKVAIQNSIEDVAVLEQAKTLLQSARQTTIANFHDQALTSNNAFINKDEALSLLGITLPSLDSNLRFKISKNMHSPDVNYTLAFGIWNSIDFKTTFTSSIADQELVIEVATKFALINESTFLSSEYFESLAIGNENDWQLFDHVILGIDSANLQLQALNAAILNTNALVHVWKSPQNRNLNYLITTRGSLSSPRSGSVTISNFGIDKVQRSLELIDAVNISEANFLTSSFSSSNVLESTFWTSLLLDKILLPSYFEIFASKDSGQDLIRYSIKSASQPSPTTFSVKVINFIKYDSEAIRTFLNNLNQSSKSKAHFLNLELQRTRVSKTVGEILGIDYQFVLSNIFSTLNVMVEKEQGQVLSYKVYEKSFDFLLLSVNVSMVSFSDFASIPSLIRIDGKAQHEIGQSLFNNLSDSSANAQIEFLRAILDKFYRSKINPFDGARIFDLVFIRSSQTWNDESGTYELTFKAQKGNEDEHSIVLKATNILKIVVHEVPIVSASGVELNVPLSNSAIFRTSLGEVYYYMFTGEELSSGVFKLDSNGQLIKDLAKNAAITNGSITGGFWFEDHDKHLYLALSDVNSSWLRLYQTNAEGVFVLLDKIRLPRLSFPFSDKQGNIFFARAKTFASDGAGGIYLFNGTEQTISKIPNSPALSIYDAIFERKDKGTAFLDASGQIWLGSYDKGIYLFNEINNSFQLIENSPTISYGFIFEDANRNLWVGANEGLYRKDSQRLEFTMIPNSPRIKNATMLLRGATLYLLNSWDGKIYEVRTNSLLVVNSPLSFDTSIWSSATIDERISIFIKDIAENGALSGVYYLIIRDS